MKTVIIQPDTHIPYQNRTHLRLFMKVLKEVQPDYLVNIGDWLDFYQISKFSKDPGRKGHISDDLDDLRLMLYQFEKVIPNTTKIFIEGNHECFDDKTEVLTSDGFIGFDEVTRKHMVGSYNEKRGSVEFSPPIGIQKYRHDGVMYRINTDEVDLFITPNHRMLIKQGGQLKYQNIEFIKNEFTMFICDDVLTVKEVLVTPDDISKKTYKGDVFCATTPNDSVVVRRSGCISITGNSRLQKYVWERAPEIHNLVVSIEKYCHFDKLGWKYFKYGKAFTLGNVLFMHGCSSGINVSMRMIRKYGVNTAHGHDHSGGIRYFQDFGKRIFTLNCGHLSDQSEQGYLYNGVADWSSGFGLIHFTDNFQTAFPQFIPINANQCIVDGKLIKIE